VNPGGRTATGFRGRPTGPSDDGAAVDGPEITAPEAWDLKGRDMTSFALNNGRVVVVSAHPDDETLAIGGLLQSLRRGGARLEMVVATDGEAAFPSLGLDRRAVLGRCRRAEMAEALRELELIDVPVTWLGFPDSALCEADLSDALRPVLATADMCLAPWPLDPHPDHRAAGVAVRKAAGVGTEVWGYPIWTWPWEHPRTMALPWRLAARHRLDEGERRRKQAAISAFASQLGPGPVGEPPIVAPEACAHFETGVEVLFRVPPLGSTPLARFADLYAANADPWGTATREYERRKREVTMASLPRARYRRALDVGCGTGLLTANLAGRCDEVVAFDGVTAAVGATRAATAGLGNVYVELARLPAQVPPGPFDLVVFSEVLYYLDSADLALALAAIDSRLEPGADILAVDWRRATHDAPRDAHSAHAQLLAHADWEVVVEHCEPQFVLHVLRRV
jgi:LmbE family N-acetylglucosaminyl deacetylase